MKRHFLLQILVLFLVALFMFPATAQAASYKKDYCNNQEYYTNTGTDSGSTYPHLHCGSDFLTYSSPDGKRYNIVNKNTFNKGTASSACYRATGQKALNLRAIISRVCRDENAVCDGCQ